MELAWALVSYTLLILLLYRCLYELAVDCIHVSLAVYVCVCSLHCPILYKKVRELIEEFNSKERFVAALIVEPIQSEGG